MLEAIRGSRSIFLLCKNEQVVNLRDILVTLHQHGAVDIAVLLGSAQHLIPHSDPRSAKTVEEASYLLSQRHTSWPEDVVICWSVLINEPGKKRAEGALDKADSRSYRISDVECPANQGDQRARLGTRVTIYSASGKISGPR